MAAILAILGIVVTPVTEAGKALVATIKRQASYLLCYRSNVDDLSKEVENLARTRNDVQGMVAADRRNGQVITDDIQKWLEKVEVVKEDAKSLNGQVKESIGCFNLRSRYRLGKEAKKKMDDVRSLQTEAKSSIVSYTPKPPTMESLPVRDFMPLESTEFSMNQVMDALKDDNINMIGVYGMGGVGKTTLMKQVAKRVESEGLFQKAIIVQKPKLKKIQREIAEQLGLKLKEESQVVRAGKLLERWKQELSNNKKILLIFDNLWERLELDDVGIPLEWNDSGCKIAFTTRSEEVCGDMKSQAKILVNVLSKEDAWDLFKEKAGDAVESPELHAVARKVVEECGCLPLAIVTVGMALYEKDKKVWDDALIQLQSSNPTNIKGMDKKVFSSLEMSYNYLESKEAQLCFLFCCLFPKGYSVSENEMRIYGTGEDLFKDVNTLEEASCRVHILFDKLKASCLLLEGDRLNSVKMHDVVRDVALSIASRSEHGFWVKANVGLKEWPEIGNVQECKRISLTDNEISILPDQIDCPWLLTLLLTMNRSLKEIPNDFFQWMNSLKVLDLCDIGISKLPPSVEGLKTLRTLRLDGCRRLKDVTLIGGLKKLEILCLQKTGIHELTEKMGELENLKLLDLRDTSLQMIAPNVISKMTRLEELHMGNSFSKWEVLGNGDARQASLIEVASLSRLTVLYIHVENVECLAQDIPGPWKNLKKFCICVGRDYTNSKAARSIKIETSPSSIGNWVVVLFKRTNELELVRCGGTENLMPSHELSFNHLKILIIKECGEMEHFVSVEEGAEPPRNVFKHLNKLSLDELMNLKMFCQGPLPASSLQNLRKLNISGCNKLINILPSDLPQNLEKLKISRCDELVEVFHFQGTSKEDALLSKLRKLQLYNLPELTSICKGVVPPLGSLHHLEDLSVEDCKRLRYLVSPALAQRLQQLKLLHIKGCEKMEKLIGVEVEGSTTASLSSSSGSRQSELTCLPHSLPHGRMFHNLQELIISECNGLHNLFSLSVAQGLLQLNFLRVDGCRRMKTIIAKEADDEVVDQGMLPRLTVLILLGLEQLTSFYQGVGVLFDWPSLEYLTVKECQNCQNFKKIQMGPHSAPNLKVIFSTKEWLEEVEWEDESLKARIQPLLSTCRMRGLQAAGRLFIFTTCVSAPQELERFSTLLISLFYIYLSEFYIVMVPDLLSFSPKTVKKKIYAVTRGSMILHGSTSIIPFAKQILQFPPVGANIIFLQ
ncbi:disease resistance protein SUMM2-like [Magnolia sinica]|uniref:disease resistance protein SUMM2-like n=1 Tax=Magnolia sinica TaxID=86752 RepID=UPI0026588E46|nr:disease resistance protein SUMM2-like [Magnolia sinica]